MTRQCHSRCMGRPGCEGIIYIAVGTQGWRDLRIKIGFTHNRGTMRRQHERYKRLGMRIEWFAECDDMGHPWTWDHEQQIHDAIHQAGVEPYAGDEFYEMHTPVYRIIMQQLIGQSADQTTDMEAIAELRRMWHNAAEFAFEELHSDYKRGAPINPAPPTRPRHNQHDHGS